MCWPAEAPGAAGPCAAIPFLRGRQGDPVWVLRCSVGTIRRKTAVCAGRGRWGALLCYGVSVLPADDESSVWALGRPADV